MALANDSLLLTPGAGAILATHLQSAKEHEVLMPARDSGHLLSTEDVYFFNTSPAANLAAVGTWLDLFNADAALIVRVLGIWHTSINESSTLGVRWEVVKTTSVGTGGTVLTAWEADENQAALDADITCRLKATGGAASGASLWWYNTADTQGATGYWYRQARLFNLLPRPLQRSGKGLVLRQNQGVKIVQQNGIAGGSATTLIGFRVE